LVGAASRESSVLEDGIVDGAGLIFLHPLEGLLRKRLQELLASLLLDFLALRALLLYLLCVVLEALLDLVVAVLGKVEVIAFVVERLHFASYGGSTVS